MDEVRIRSGALNGRTEMPKLKPPEIIDGEKHGAEIGYQEEEKALYVGTKDGNVRLCGLSDAEKLAELSAKIEEITARLDELTG